MAETIQQLESQALAFEKAGNVADAIDLYEEIDRRGAATPQHLVQLGNCLLKSRQRQNAMDIWFRVLQMQPGFPPAVEALNQYFPNWEGRFEKFIARGNRVAPREATPPPRPPVAPAAGDSSAPPPPPPPAAAAAAPKVSLTVETVTRPAAPAPQSPPPRSVPVAEPQPIAAFAPAQSAAQPAAFQSHHYSDAAEVSEEDIMDSRVNWKYILADAQEEAAAHA